jgi:hypothetical protein
MTNYNGLPVRPYYVSPVNAGSACVIEYSSRNLDNELEAPSTLEYRIDNLTDSIVIAEWASIPTPGTTGEVVISAEQNAMSYQYRDKQLNQVMFRATYANGQQVKSAAYIEVCALFQGMG